MLGRSLKNMHNMPNPDAPDCGCNWFPDAAKDDSSPVVFDELMNEYHLKHNNDSGYSLFYHCPFCGGKAPETLRGSFWTEVSSEESHRLEQLTKNIKTPKELFVAFGDPDQDHEVGGGYISPGSEDQPPELTLSPRRVVFKSLSETVDVHVSIDRYDRLRFSYQGRYIGPKQDKKANKSQ
jgi:hypothetical protein